MMTADEIVAFDLRRIAIHEAGHLVALLELGGNGYIRLSEREDSDLLNRGAYSGKVYILDPLEREDDRRIMAMAGEVAGLLDSDPDTHPEEVVDYFESEADSISATDKAHGVTYEAAEQAIEILTRRWDEVLHHAQCEIDKEEATP